MPRFVKFLQILIAVIVGGYLGYELVLEGISIFKTNLFASFTVVLTLFLELALFVIYKLIEED